MLFISCRDADAGPDSNTALFVLNNHPWEHFFRLVSREQNKFCFTEEVLSVNSLNRKFIWLSLTTEDLTGKALILDSLNSVDTISYYTVKPDTHFANTRNY